MSKKIEVTNYPTGRITNIGMLRWGMAHIARNHGFYAVDAMSDYGQISICGGSNVPTVADVQLLCEDLGIDRGCIRNSSYGIDVNVSCYWYADMARKSYHKGMEFWKRLTLDELKEVM